MDSTKNNLCVPANDTATDVLRTEYRFTGILTGQGVRACQQ
ncbi:MAG: hypothetical protein AAB306_05580 [Pseudomonadota bacterium]|mgnify:FL=1